MANLKFAIMDARPVLDKRTAATAAGAPAVGRRIEVRWAGRWEAGTVAEHLVQLERDVAVVRVRVVYDDGEEQLEDLRAVDARLCGARAADAEGFAHEWTELRLQCCITWRRLDDPAKAAGCRHAACCNFDALLELAARRSGCPVFGCEVALSKRNVTEVTLDGVETEKSTKTGRKRYMLSGSV